MFPSFTVPPVPQACRKCLPSAVRSADANCRPLTTVTVLPPRPLRSRWMRAVCARGGKAAGGQMEVMTPIKFREVEFPEGIDLKRWEVYGDILDADVVINVPIAKDHGIARLTLGGKNLMGVVTNRGAFHINLGQRVADTLSRVRPALTVIDAVRILMANGPTGGDLGDVKLANTVIASADTVAADAYATGLFGLKPTDIAYIKAGAAMGLGTMDLGTVRVDEFEVA